MRIITHRGRGWLAATAAMATLGLAGQIHAQYAPYGGGQTQYNAGQTQYAAGQPQFAVQPQYNPYVVVQQPTQPQQPQYAAQGAYQGYAAAQNNSAQPQTGSVQPQNYATPYGVPRVAMAYQGGAAASSPTPVGDTLPLTAPVESVVPGALQNGAYAPQPQPMPESYPTAGSGMGYAPGGAYESYPAAGGNAGCNTGYNGASAYGACTPYSTYGGCNTDSTYGSMGGVLSKHAGCGYWFGGVYGILMDRDNSNKYPLVFSSADSAPDGYYPPTTDIVLRTRDADIGFQPGVEFRLGRTFGCGPVNPCDPCGCSACGPRWGLEGAYWILFEEDDTAYYVDQATLRTYSMMPMAGLEYDPGAGYRPVNEYWDYGPPVRTQDIRVTLTRVHSNFEAQNLEINLLRLGVCGGGCGGATYTAACGVDACGGCDRGAGACGGCDSSACSGYGACAPRVGSRFSCTGVCGFRWMQFNEDFMYGVDFFNTTTTATGFLNYWSTVENNLFGAQIGCNGMYRIGCKWGLHLNSAVGLYGNDVDVRQYMVSPTGQVRFIGTQENFDVRAYKTDVSMVGELRLGASYQATCHCRLYGGWRAIGVTGIALATDQAPNQFLDANQLRNYVNSNGSLILHGLQAGVEWNY